MGLQAIAPVPFSQKRQGGLDEFFGRGRQGAAGFADERNRLAILVEVRLAGRARRDVGLEAGARTRRQGVVEIFDDEAIDIAARERAPEPVFEEADGSGQESAVK